MSGSDETEATPGIVDETAEETIAGIVQEASELGGEDRWAEARDLVLGAIEDHGEDAGLLCWLGIAAQRLAEDGEAYEAFRRCLALEPQDPFVLAAAGSGAAAFDDPQAESALRLAALTAPTFAFARAAYGAYLSREGLLVDAVRELEAARDLTPDDPAVRVDLGVALLLGGRNADGIGELEEALSLRHEDSWVRGLLGLALVEAGRDSEGAEALHQASQERPEDVEVQLLAALACAAEGWEDEAWAALARGEEVVEAPDAGLVQEVEEAVGGGPEAAADYLRDELGPVVLRERLLQRG